jgi:hypothetical protein
MATHPNYLRVEDASHDSTYATFFFSIPEAHREQLITINAPEPFDPAKEFEAMLANLKKWDGKSRAPVAQPEAVTKLMGDIVEKLGIEPKR